MENKKSFQKVMLIILGILLTVVIGVGVSYVFLLQGTSYIGWIILGVLVLVAGFLQYKFAIKGIKNILIIFIITFVAISTAFVFTTKLGKNNIYTPSSIVSSGVSKKDLGNILNEQFFFDDGKNQYFSDFDDNDIAHIYQKDKKSKEIKEIFDGFGWSLIIRENYLYFSGNKGPSIDGTYNLYKMSLDDYSFSILDKGFCYGMSFNNEWLYYINKDTDNSYVYVRLNVETNEKELIDTNNSSGVIVVYNRKLYYLNSIGYIMRANLDGTNAIKVIDEKCQYFIIGNGKLIYLKDGKEIKTCDIDGGNINTITKADIDIIGAMNSINNTIYYVKYSSKDYNSETGGYTYSLWKVGFNGKNDKLIYRSMSNSFYINIIDKNVYALDYYLREGDEYYTAIISKMGLKGEKLEQLER